MNEYGGDYDYFYSRVKKLMLSLKDSIEIIFFYLGSESLVDLQRNIETIGNFYNFSHIDHIKQLREFKSLFASMILFKIISELNIQYSVVDSSLNEAIAGYASGLFNSKYFTVLANVIQFNFRINNSNFI